MSQKTLSLFSFPEMFTFTLDVDRHYHILMCYPFLFFFYEVVESDGQIVSVWVYLPDQGHLI